jgi:hypothetical protein
VLKINLLPPYIYEKRKVARVGLLCLVIFVVIFATMLAWSGKKSAELAKWEEDATQMEQQAAQVQAIQSQVQAEQAKGPALQTKVNFQNDLEKYNVVVPKLYEDVSKWTYNRIVYSSMSVSGNSLQMQAHARTLGDAARYLMNMYRATELFSAVNMGFSVPSWPAGTQSIADSGGLDFQVSCTLITPINAPSYGGGGGAATAAAGPSAGAMGAAGGMGGAMQGGAMKGAGMKGGAAPGGAGFVPPTPGISQERAPRAPGPGGG